MLTQEAYKQFFESRDFQKKWQAYKDAFGKDLDGLFGENYNAKVRLTEGLQLLLDGKLHDAYHGHIRHFAGSCETKTDRRIYERLVNLCYNEKEMATVRAGDWVKRSLGDDFLYARVEKRIAEGAVVKEIFTRGLVYMRDQVRDQPYFRLEITDLKCYQLPSPDELARIHAYFAEHPEEDGLTRRNTERMLAYRDAALKSGMQEAAWEHSQFHFYRRTADKTAFALNLKDFGTHIRVVYGFTTIPDEDFFRDHGGDDDDIKLRHAAIIRDDEDEAEAARAIQAVYEQYRHTEKDDILALKKERQKEFLSRIHAYLKPLGFAKKAYKWTRKLPDGFVLEFEAQKSAYSDIYYFNISLYPVGQPYPACFSTRLTTDGEQTHNWQILTDEQFREIMAKAIETYLRPILQTPRSELGKDSRIWTGCLCQRDRCEACWVEKNLWEAKEETK
ncbi:MAG: DUF4304 domain-containing protein [Clostridia bacterium]|nr:DUF4304 domain-containing protein [Clostridia bacterium]